MSLPISQLGETYTEDVRVFLRNNVTDVAQVLKSELIPQHYTRNVKFVATDDKKVLSGKIYYVRDPVPSRDALKPADKVWHYSIANFTPGTPTEGLGLLEKKYDDVVIGGYPKYNLPRGYGNVVYDTAFDTKWFDGIGMHKQPEDSAYPMLQGYNVYATPLVLEGMASYLVEMNWRLRLLIDGALSVLIDKFVITKDPPTELAELNGSYYLYEQTTDKTFQPATTYYRRAKNGYYSVTVTVGAPVRTQSGYELPTETEFLDNKEYYKRVVDPYTLAGYKYVLMKKDIEYHVGDPIPIPTPPAPRNIYTPVYEGFNNYYVRTELPYADYYLRKVELDSTTPEINRYYVPVESGSTVVDGKQYYYYNKATNDFIRCSVHPVVDTSGVTPVDIVYYTLETSITYSLTTAEYFGKSEYYAKLDSETTYKKLTAGVDYAVGDSVEDYCNAHGTLADPCHVYEQIVTHYYAPIDLDDAKNQRPDSFDGRTIYRTDGFGGYICVGKGSGCNCIFISKTKNNTYAADAWRSSKLYVPLAKDALLEVHDGSILKKLYVDPKDEDICRIKDLINLFLTRYRTVLVGTGRKVVDLIPLKGNVAYTTTELVSRINSILSSMNEYIEPATTPRPIGCWNATGDIYDSTREYLTLREGNRYTRIEDNSLIKTVTIGKDVRIADSSLQSGLGNVSVYAYSDVEPTEMVETIDCRDATDEIYNKDLEYYVRKGFGTYVIINNNELIETVVVDGKKVVAPASQQELLGNVTVYTSVYTARDMKLRVNNIIDYIVSESYYLNVFLDTFDKNLLKFEDDFWMHKGVSKLLYNMATTSDEPGTVRTYNDRWYFYEPSLPYVDEVHSKLNLTDMIETTDAKYVAGTDYYVKSRNKFVKLIPGTDYEVGDDTVGNEYVVRPSVTATVPAVIGNIRRETVNPSASPAQYGDYYVYTGEQYGWVQLCRVANVYKIAENWSNCNYSGCMQILSLTLHMLQSNTPERVSWKKAVTDPKVPVSPAMQTKMNAVLAQINAMEDRITMLLAYAPHVADIVVDIGYHVTTQFKMQMDDVFPELEEISTYVKDKVYLYYNSVSHKYVGVKPAITNATMFAEKLALYGKLYTWNFHHKKK